MSKAPGSGCREHDQQREPAEHNAITTYDQKNVVIPMTKYLLLNVYTKCLNTKQLQLYYYGSLANHRGIALRLNCEQ